MSLDAIGPVPVVAGLTELFRQVPHGLQHVRHLREELAHAVADVGVPLLELPVAGGDADDLRPQLVVLLLEGPAPSGRLLQLAVERVLLGEHGGEDVLEDMLAFLNPCEYTSFVTEHTLHQWLLVLVGGFSGSRGGDDTRAPPARGERDEDGGMMRDVLPVIPRTPPIRQSPAFRKRQETGLAPPVLLPSIEQDMDRAVVQEPPSNRQEQVQTLAGDDEEEARPKWLVTRSGHHRGARVALDADAVNAGPSARAPGAKVEAIVFDTRSAPA